MKGLLGYLLPILAFFLFPMAIADRVFAACPTISITVVVKDKNSEQAKADAVVGCKTIAKETCDAYSGCTTDVNKSKLTYPAPFTQDFAKGWKISFDSAGSMEKKEVNLRSPIKKDERNPLILSPENYFECTIKCAEQATSVINEQVDAILEALELLEDPNF